MTEKKIKKTNIDKLLKEWSKEYLVLIPSYQENGQITFRPLKEGKEIDCQDGYQNTFSPAKTSFFLPREKMFDFKKGDDGYLLSQSLPEKEKFILFGVRACDARSLKILDLVFMDTYQDPYYLPRRENGIIVGISCHSPADTCFCTSLDIDPVSSSDGDLWLTDTGEDCYLLRVNGKKGEALLALASNLEEVTKDDETKVEEFTRRVKQKIVKTVDLNGIDGKLRNNFENEQLWKNIAAKCIGCGICTYYCPTCHCFDINDEMVRADQGERIRSWDSCAFPLFTKMPVENPRKEKWRRVRQRVHHKFEYFPLNFGVVACVGCGRCISACPVNLDITQTLQKISE